MMQQKIFLIIISLLIIECTHACPTSCKCNRAKRRVSCMNDLTEVPRDLPSYTQELDLSGNAITSLPSGVFSHLPNLVNLLLTGNNITTIEAGAFRGLQKLKHLNLRTNKLTSLRVGIFRGIPRTLKTIYLHENEISSIEEGTFRDLSKANLNLLSMGNNQFKKIEDGYFIGLEKLKTLILDNNMIEVFASSALKSLKNVRKVTLEGNRLTYFYYDVTMSLLSSLNLANNSLSDLLQNEFSGFSRLLVLNVSYNAIVSIREGVLDKLIHMKSLDLRNNKLRHLPDLSKLTRLKNVYFDGNTWECNCKIQDMRRWIETTDYDVICSGPEKKNGQNLKSFLIEDLTCASVVPHVQPTQSIVTKPAIVTSHSSESDVTTTSAFYCPYQCDCSIELKHANCNQQGFTRVPTKMSRATKLLDLRRNEIRTMDRDSFTSTPNLISLHLQHNSVYRVEPFAFRGLKKLVYLYLNHNEINDIDKRSFADLESLSYLFLDNNRISYIPDAVFRPLSSVFTIYLHHNLITDLNDRSLIGLQSLRWLYLSNNRLTRIRNGTFQHCDRLQRLFLSSNQLDLFPLQAVSGILWLDTLDLSSNFVDVISTSSAVELTQLKSLNVAFNQITQIENGFLIKLENLRDLNVSGNMLGSMPTLPGSLHKIDFDGNSWRCDCYMRSLYKFMKSSQPISSTPITCQSPSVHKDKELMDLIPGNLVCKQIEDSSST